MTNGFWDTRYCASKNKYRYSSMWLFMHNFYFHVHLRSHQIDPVSRFQDTRYCASKNKYRYFFIVVIIRGFLFWIQWKKPQIDPSTYFQIITILSVLAFMISCYLQKKKNWNIFKKNSLLLAHHTEKLCQKNHIAWVHGYWVKRT